MEALNWGDGFSEDKTISLEPLTEQTDPAPEIPSQEVSLPRGLRFTVPDFNATFEISVRTSIMIGRRTSDQDGQVDVDLTPYEGRELGVSRYHAIIQLSGDNQLYIKDLDSTNGTYLNGYALRPLDTYRLNDGDQITIGGLPLQIRYLRHSQQLDANEAAQRQLDAIVERLKAIRWGEKTSSTTLDVSNVVLMQEFLRRTRLWAVALNVEHQWPLFDIAKVAYPPLRSQTQKLSQVTSSLFPNMFTRMTCHWAIHWTEAAHTEHIQQHNLPNPYEPLLRLYENGAWFQRDGDTIAIWETPGLWTHIDLVPRQYDSLTPFAELP